MASGQEVIPARGTLTDRSGSITSGGTAQQLAAANGNRAYLLVQNISSDNLWVNFGTNAVQDQPSIRLAPGEHLELSTAVIPTETVSIIGPTTGQKFVAKEG